MDDPGGPRWPISVKGVLAWGGEVVVLRNERDEWELPGGRLEPDDASPAHAVKREFREELDVEIEVGDLLDTWIYDVAGKRVVILTFRCSAPKPDVLLHSDEHSAVRTMSLAELERSARAGAIPSGYVRSVRLALG
ncbi:MAG: NUDIX domain-containing protein [Actinomycetota bacterium]